jgi:hypothetical protein
MPRAYSRGAYRFSPDDFDQNDFSEATNTQIGPDDFQTVERFAPGEGSSARLGLGTSQNPLQAEGSVDANPQNSTPADIGSKYRLVVENEQNNVIDVLAQGSVARLRKTRSNSIDGDILPVTDREIYEPFKIGFQLKTASGTATYSASDSSLDVDGYRGEKLR